MAIFRESSNRFLLQHVKVFFEISDHHTGGKFTQRAKQIKIPILQIFTLGWLVGGTVGDKNDNINICKQPLFTLGIIYNTKASGAENTTETNDSS